MTGLDLDQSAEAVRRFNRLYTKKIGILGDRYLRSPFSLTEVRVLYELAHRDDMTASELGKELELDAGYLSRILRGFEERGFVKKTRSQSDGRQSLLSLTNHGRNASAELNQRSHDDIGAMLSGLEAGRRDRLIRSFGEIEHLLGGSPDDVKAPYLLRPQQPGDIGWVVHRHGLLYAEEYGFDERFEAMVAEIVAEFIRNLDPRRERCWIAERESEIVGSVFLVRQSETIAKLRLLLVEPSARGLGIGRRLVEECIRFARQSGYREITLWTHSILTAARKIYEQAGFHRTDAKPHADWGPEVIGETWVLNL